MLIFKLQIVHGHNIPVLNAHLLQPVKQPALAQHLVKIHPAFIVGEIDVAHNRHNLRNKGLKMYVTAEPCVMCAGGIMWSGIDTVYYSVNSKDVQKLTGFDEGYKPLLWKAQFKKRGINLYGGIEESAGRASLDKYVLDGHKVYKPERQDNNDQLLLG